MPTHFGVKNRMVLQFHASPKVETRWTPWTCILLDFPILFPSFSIQFRAVDIYIWQLFLWIKHVLLESQDLKKNSCCIGSLHLPDVAAKSQVCNYLLCFPRISFKKIFMTSNNSSAWFDLALCSWNKLCSSEHFSLDLLISVINWYSYSCLQLYQLIDKLLN